MATITFIEHNGTNHTVQVPNGKSVMQAAVDNNVPGIDADCGGECACATCHVYVDAAWLDKVGLPVPGSQEASMLSFAAVTQSDSRLSCQITGDGRVGRPGRSDARGPALRQRRAVATFDPGVTAAGVSRHADATKTCHANRQRHQTKTGGSP